MTQPSASLTNLLNPQDIANVEATLAELVRKALRHDILSLAFHPGMHLTLRELTERYGVRATPVREALWSLVGEGLVESEAKIGFRVPRLKRDRLSTLAALRLRIEPWGLAQSLESAGKAWVASVERAYAGLTRVDALVGDQRKIDDNWESAHRAFHMALLSGCQPASLLREVEAWYVETDRYRRLSSPGLGATAANKYDHDILFDAVMSMNAGLAVETLERHILETSQRHQAYFDAAHMLDD